MDNIIFTGLYRHVIGEKNRIFIPSKFRKNTDIFIITPGFDNCLYGYEKNSWIEINKKIDNIDMKDKNKIRAFKRMFFSISNEVKCDILGRIIIPGELKTKAKIKKKVVIVGVGDRFEIWAEELWKKYEKKSENIFKKVTEDLEI